MPRHIFNHFKMYWADRQHKVTPTVAHYNFAWWHGRDLQVRVQDECVWVLCGQLSCEIAPLFDSWTVQVGSQQVVVTEALASGVPKHLQSYLFSSLGFVGCSFARLIIPHNYQSRSVRCPHQNHEGLTTADQVWGRTRVTRLDVDDNTRNRFLSLARITGASERCVPVNSVHLSATLAAVVTLWIWPGSGRDMVWHGVTWCDIWCPRHADSCAFSCRFWSVRSCWRLISPAVQQSRCRKAGIDKRTVQIVEIVEIVDLCVWVSNVLLCKGLTVQELLPGSMSFLWPCGSSGRGHSCRGGDGMWIHTGFFKKTAILSHPLRRNLHAPFPPIPCFCIALLGKAFKKKQPFRFGYRHALGNNIDPGGAGGSGVMWQHVGP